MQNMPSHLINLQNFFAKLYVIIILRRLTRIRSFKHAHKSISTCLLLRCLLEPSILAEAEPLLQRYMQMQDNICAVLPASSLVRVAIKVVGATIELRVSISTRLWSSQSCLQTTNTDYVDIF